MTERGAAVIGAGVAGLLAARVLADRVERVTIVDRDLLAGVPEPRKGVPQGRHAHGLLASGDGVIRELFPGLIEELVAGGAQPANWYGARWWQYGGYRVPAEAPDATFFTRPYLEHGIRRRVESMGQVTTVRGSVQGVAFDDRVTGVIVNGENGPTTIEADLVVDASGRASGAGRWLEAHGYQQPPVLKVHIDMGYATGLFHRTPGRLPEGTWIITIGDPAVSKRFGVAFPIEGQRWIVTLAGVHGDHAPTDPAGFLQWAETLPTSDVADIIGNEQLVGPIVTHRLESDQWRHFEKVKRHPAGFVAIGDSICSFNPVYGQGMSSAAQQAVALAGTLDRVGLDSPQLPGLFYKSAAKIIANPWAVATGGDFCFRETTGARPPMVDRLNRYVKKAVIAAQHDPVVARALADVQNLMAPPPSLMKPHLMVRVFRGARRGPTGIPLRVAAS